MEGHGKGSTTLGHGFDLASGLGGHRWVQRTKMIMNFNALILQFDLWYQGKIGGSGIN